MRLGIALFVLFCGILTVTVHAHEHLVLTSDNHVALLDEVTSESVPQWTQSFYSKAGPNVNLIVYIDSPGGSIDDGLHLIEQMVHLRETYNMTLRCVVRRAFSMAFGIFQLGCDERLITPNGVLMQHQASYGVGGSHHVVRSRLELYRKQIAQFETRQAAVLQLTLGAFRARTNNEWWLDADEALDHHAADSVATIGCDPELAQDIVSENTFISIGPFAVRQRVRKSRCPLIGIIDYDDDDDDEK